MLIEKSKDPQKFVDFERAGWGANIAGYDHTFGLVSRQTVRPMLDAAKVLAGMRVLDVCTGPGMLAAAAIARGAHAVGLDLPSEVVELAQKNVPAGEFQQGDAQRLPFADSSFDAVLCGYGVMHLPEPEAALNEMLRVVRPGRRVALSVWHSETPTNAFSLIYAAVRAHGNLNVPLPHGPDFFQFGTPAKMQAALNAVGFLEIETTLFDQYWSVGSARQILDAISTGTVRARALLTAQTDDVRAKIHEFIAEQLTGLADGKGRFRVPLPAVIGSGSKP